MKFIDEDFLLSNGTAKHLYRTYAEHQPILDYHNHLPVRQIADDYTFQNLYDIWIAGDHYKWRAMRTNGVEEHLCTGDADPRDKFMAWAKTVPDTLRNPLYHWTHLELKRYFGIDELLDGSNALPIWSRANELLHTPELTAQGILKKFNVAALCTTDDPIDDLSAHKKIARSGLGTRVYPAYRPDRVFAINQPVAFNAWVERLASVSNTDITKLQDLLDALDERHRAFHATGCRLSDHGLTQCFADFPDDATASAIFDRARSGQAADPGDYGKFASYMMLFFGRLDAQRGWTKQLHLGALRNARTRGFELLGPDTGYDSIGDYPQAAGLCAYLDRLDREDMLPKMVLYNVNPTDNYLFATMAGNFQDGKIRGKVQFGAGWWFLDTKEGIEWQLNAVSNIGLLSRFIGMLTDSRSFMSFPRHEYFRRVLCNMLGREIESGDLPDNEPLVGEMIANICYANAKDFLNLPGLSAE